MFFLKYEKESEMFMKCNGRLYKTQSGKDSGQLSHCGQYAVTLLRPLAFQDKFVKK